MTTAIQNSVPIIPQAAPPVPSPASGSTAMGGGVALPNMQHGIDKTAAVHSKVDLAARRKQMVSSVAQQPLAKPVATAAPAGMSAAGLAQSPPAASAAAGAVVLKDEIDEKLADANEKAMTARVLQATANLDPSVTVAKTERAFETLFETLAPGEKMDKDKKPHLLKRHNFVWCFACEQHRRINSHTQFKEQHLARFAGSFPFLTTGSQQALRKAITEFVRAEARRTIEDRWVKAFFTDIDQADPTSRATFWADLEAKHPTKKAEISTMKDAFVQARNTARAKVLEIITAYKESFLKHGIPINSDAFVAALNSYENCDQAFCKTHVSKFSLTQFQIFQKLKLDILNKYKALDAEFEAYRLQNQDALKDKNIRECLNAFILSKGTTVDKKILENYAKAKDSLSKFQEIHDGYQAFEKLNPNLTLEQCMLAYCRKNAFCLSPEAMVKFMEKQKKNPATVNPKGDPPRDGVEDVELQYVRFKSTYSEILQKLRKVYKEVCAKVVVHLSAQPASFEAQLVTYEQTFINTCLASVETDVLSLLDEYHNHTSTRFVRLLSIHADFVERTAILHQEVSRTHPGEEGHILTIIEKNFLDVCMNTKDEFYRDVQGQHEQLDSVKATCSKNQKRLAESYALVMDGSAISNLDYSHALPAPGIFSWKRFDPKYKGTQVGSWIKDFHIEDHRVRIQKDPYLTAQDKDIRALFQSAVVENIRSIPRPLDSIKFTLGTFVFWALNNSSETDRLPKFCNSIDTVSEERLSKLKPPINFKVTIMQGTRSMIEAVLKKDKLADGTTAQGDFRTALFFQTDYLEAVRESIFKQVDTLNVTAGTLEPRQLIANAMERYMLGSTYVALRSTVVGIGKRSAADWPDLDVVNSKLTDQIKTLPPRVPTLVAPVAKANHKVGKAPAVKGEPKGAANAAPAKTPMPGSKKAPGIHAAPKAAAAPAGANATPVIPAGTAPAAVSPLPVAVAAY